VSEKEKRIKAVFLTTCITKSC